jgi:hypothetical protein
LGSSLETHLGQDDTQSRTIIPIRGSTSEAVITRKVDQPYLLKSSWKKKYTDWNIQKILFFVIENKGYRVD